MNNPSVNYQEIIRDNASKHFNVGDVFKNNTYQENVEICKNDRLPFSVGTINITGELNVGMMIRSACLLGAEKFYTFGRKKYDKRSTVGAEKYIDIVQYTYDDPIHADESILQDLCEINHDIILCEQGGYEIGSASYKELTNNLDDPLFLFGSESFGVPENILNYPNFHKVSIPQRGVLRSFNVSAAMNIMVWDYLKENYMRGENE